MPLDAGAANSPADAGLDTPGAQKGSRRVLAPSLGRAYVRPSYANFCAGRGQFGHLRPRGAGGSSESPGVGP